MSEENKAFDVESATKAEILSEMVDQKLLSADEAEGYKELKQDTLVNFYKKSLEKHSEIEMLKSEKKELTKAVKASEGSSKNSAEQTGKSGEVSEEESKHIVENRKLKQAIKNAKSVFSERVKEINAIFEGL